MKKKLLSLILSAILVASVGLVGCGKTDNSSADVDKPVSADSVSNKEGLSEEEAWKLEPAYGKSIKIGYNGGLC